MAERGQWSVSSDAWAADPQVEEAEPQEQEQEPQQPTPTPSPPRSNGGMDVATQLRLWKERGARMEQLLAKKNTKIQEMEETVSY